MKFLIQTAFKDGPEPDAATAKTAFEGSISHLKALKGVESLYGYGHGDALAIVDVPTVDEAWKLILSNPMSRYLKIEVHPLTNLIDIQQHLLDNLM